jgi:hypothetical protein
MCPGWTQLEMARPVRFELTTPCSGGMYSIHLSYGRAAKLLYLSNQFSLSRNPPLVASPRRSFLTLRAILNFSCQFFDFFGLFHQIQAQDLARIGFIYLVL